MRGSRKLVGRGAAAINKKIEGCLVGKGPKNRKRSPANSATFTIFESNFGIRRASRDGIGVYPGSIGCSASNTEHPEVLVIRRVESAGKTTRRCAKAGVGHLPKPLDSGECAGVHLRDSCVEKFAGRKMGYVVSTRLYVRQGFRARHRLRQGYCTRGPVQVRGGFRGQHRPACATVV